MMLDSACWQVLWPMETRHVNVGGCFLGHVGAFVLLNCFKRGFCHLSTLHHCHCNSVLQTNLQGKDPPQVTLSPVPLKLAVFNIQGCYMLQRYANKVKQQAHVGCSHAQCGLAYSFRTTHCCWRTHENASCSANSWRGVSLEGCMSAAGHITLAAARQEQHSHIDCYCKQNAAGRKASLNSEFVHRQWHIHPH